MANANVVSVVSQKKANSLVKRIASVLVPLPLILGLIYVGSWAVTILVVVAALVSFYEFCRALRQVGYAPRFATGIAILSLIITAVVASRFTSFPVMPLALSGTIMLALTGELRQRDTQQGLTGWAFTFAGASYLGWLFSYFILLREIDTPLQTGLLAPLAIAPGAAWIYFVLATTWLQDTGAYLVGRSFGRHKMAPIVSPGKTWEGAAGGIITALGAALLAKVLLGLPISYGMVALLGVVGGIAGLVGDLAESVIKRRIGLKDMGNIMPGHGGILDRSDSLLFAAPVLYYLILLLTS
jgi:phosphatidate cytidylyltransferase